LRERGLGKHPSNLGIELRHDGGRCAARDNQRVPAVRLEPGFAMKKPPPILTPRIIADLRAGEECVDPDHPGLRVRRTNAARLFFYRYRSQDGVLRQIKLGEFGPMTLAEARKTLGRLKLERDRGIDPQLQKQQARTAARRQRKAEKNRRGMLYTAIADLTAARQPN